MTLSRKNQKTKKKRQTTKGKWRCIKTEWSVIFFFYKKDIRKKQNNVVWHLVCYSEKDRKNGELEGKKNFFPPPFGRCLPCLLWLLSWWGVHRCCGAHSVKLGWLGGGIDRGDVGGCCKPNRGCLVRGITFCVRFPNQHPLFFCFFVNFGLNWERRPLATL